VSPEVEQRETPFVISVSKLSGESLAELELDGSSTVRDLKQEVMEATGINRSFGVQLVHGEKVLTALDDSLAQLGFEPGVLAHVSAVVDECPTFEFKVLADGHKHGPREKGMYFHFAREAVVGLDEKATMKGSLVNSRTGEKGAVVLWGNANGGSSGDAHGRFDPLSARRFGQFQVGDVLRFTRRRKSSHEITVLADDHAHGPAETGMYFHFSRADVEVLGKSQSLQGKVTNDRTGESGEAILWARANGGSEGDAHGRFHPPSKRRVGQFQRGDVLQFEVS